MPRNILTLVLLMLCCTTGFAQKQDQERLITRKEGWVVKISDGWFSAKTVSFGPYNTSSRKNSIADASAVSFIKDPINPFNIRVSGKEEDILIQVIQAAHIAFSGRPLPSFLDNMPATALFSYMLIEGSKKEPLKRWEMILKDMTYLELNDNKPAGVLRSADDEIRITANNKWGVTNSYDNISYEFHQRRHVVAFVVTGTQPYVWMSEDLEGTPLQPVLAAAIGALLMR